MGGYPKDAEAKKCVKALTKQRVGNCQHLVSRLSGSWGKEWTVAHYTLNVVVEGLDLDDSTQNQFLAELSYVAAPSRIAGVDSVEIEIEAETPIDAWSQISVDLKQIQVIVKRIDLDLVNANEIALRLDVNRETVRLWGKGERRAGFPRPSPTRRERYCGAGRTSMPGLSAIPSSVRSSRSHHYLRTWWTHSTEVLRRFAPPAATNGG